MLKPTRVDWREGISQIVECVGVETPHCGNVEMWWIHIVKMWRCGGSTFLVWRSTLISNYPRINVNFHYADPQYICIYSHLKCGNPHCSTIHPHCSTLHPPSKCGDVVDPHCIHILRVKVHIASTSQATWTLSSTSYH